MIILNDYDRLLMAKLHDLFSVSNETKTARPKNITHWNCG